MLDSFSCQICLLSSVFSLLVLWLNEALWFVNLVLKVFSVNPMYVLSGFKTRFTNHKASFNHKTKRLNTELSKHIWQLKESNTRFKITWKILKQASPYNPASSRCNLCLWEKYFIICRPNLASLNKRNELITSCRHANKFLLKSFKVSKQR